MARTKEDQETIDAITGIMVESRKSGFNQAEALFAAGYRIDPYPAGKSKQELIDIIWARDSAIDRSRLLLREEHTAHIGDAYGITMEKHREFKPDCKVCKFLEETSTVKS